MADAVRLTSGRLPHSCTRSRCEVLAIGGSADRLRLAATTLALDVVGTAVRANPLLVS